MKAYQIKLIIKSAIYLVLFAALVLFAIIPTLNRFNKNKIDLSDRNQKLVTAQNDFETLIKLRKDDATREDVKKNVTTYLPDEKSTTDFVVKIESLSQETGITVPALTTVEPKTQTKTAKATSDETDDTKAAAAAKETTTKTTPAQNSVEFSLSFSNSYEKVAEFISRMNSMLRLNSLESISISNYNPENGTLDFQTKGKIYYGK